MLPLPENRSAVAHSSEYEFSPEECQTLLVIARHAIEARVAEESFDVESLAEHVSPRLHEIRAAFTTLFLSGHLRGCVGFATPLYPLYRTIAETAVSAAFLDPRFPPVTQEEMRQLRIEISVLSPLQPLEASEANDVLQIGRHGLLITHTGRRGLLLPQVAAEHGWDATAFLENICLKAGLHRDAWREPAARLEMFTAEIFGD
ncbi:MAG: AmmeMemoRadiSam system protein A [Acidobacteriales bacterium]|nr:AmmeMemoRadiSam system protein A [Terriglobales bacterium]